MEEDQLLKLAAAGDGAALATLLQAHEEELLSYVRRRLPINVRFISMPEDVVQDTCYEACRMIGGFVPTGKNSFQRWLTTIANFRIKATIKKFRVHRTYAISASDSAILSEIDQILVNSRSPSRSAAAHEFIARFQRGVEALKPEYRDVLTYRFIERLSVQDTGNRMSRDEDEIYKLTSRALQALRLQMQVLSDPFKPWPNLTQ